MRAQKNSVTTTNSPLKDITAATKAAALKGAEAAAWTAAAARVLEDSRVARDAKVLKARIATLPPVMKRAQKAFKAFVPSSFGKNPPRQNYLAPGAKLAPLQNKVITRGIDAIRATDATRSIRLKKTDTLAALIKDSSRGGKAGSIGLDKVYDYIGGVGSGLMLNADSTTPISLCKAQIEAERIAHQVKGDKSSSPSDIQPGDAPAAHNNDGNVTATALKEAAAQVVKDGVSLQMRDVTSPEAEVAYPLPDRSKDVGALKDRIQTFELRSGPADVTAYHDFYSLQIAFEDVWTELLDGDLKSFGEQLYSTYVETGQRLQLDNIDPPGEISTLQDLKALMDEVQTLVGLVPPNDPLNNGGGLFGGLFGSALGGLFGLPSGGTYGANGNSPDSQPGAIADTSRLALLLTGLQNRLKGVYAFKVFAENSINFGVLTTYRQTWEPLNYQVGELLKTVPLAPKETRKYTVRTLQKKTRAVKELDDSLRVLKKESIDTSRVDAEIVAKAQTKTNFDVMAKESFKVEIYNIESTQKAGGESAKQSENIKKEFRESVLKSTEEYRQENKKEIDTTVSEESETTSLQELQNPNDELPVTYLFYELQRQYQISEQLHELTPVVLVANRVPAPHEITDAWLVEHDWILNRVILDDTFRPALQYLSTSFVGEEINIRILQDNAGVQHDLVQTLKQQLLSQNQLVSAANQAVTDAVRQSVQGQESQGLLKAVHTIFDPLSISQTPDIGNATALQAQVDYAKEQLDRAEKERRKLESDLQVAITALQSAIDKLGTAVKEHFDKLTGVDRLRVHIKDNILYYMQAIWSHEPPDQRYFRLYDLDLPIIVATMNGVTINLDGSDIPQWRSPSGKFVSTTLPIPPKVGVEIRKLTDVADLDRLLGYKGNYMIFPLKANNYLTWHMMQDYLEVGDELTLRDPDEFANYTLEEIQELAACYYQRDRQGFKKQEAQFKQEIINRLLSARKESDLVVVPTSSLYIEALVGTHTLLEDFKLIHRAIDVKKVQAEVRHAELENIRLASRALKGEDEDPDIEKKIVIETNDKNITLQPDGN